MVIVVREFLEQQILNIKSEYIRFELLGPSPFHAECYIEPGVDIEFDESISSFLSKDITTEVGYNKIIFYYDISTFENGTEAADYIFHEIIIELSFFYEIGRLRLLKMRRWVRFEEMLDAIIPENKKKGIMNRFLKFIYYSGKIKELFIEIAIFEKENIFANEGIKNDYKCIYSDKWDSHFKTFIDNAMKEQETYPTRELIQLLSYLEDKRAKNLELITMFVSAIIGGGIGALITLLMTNK